MEKEDSYPLGSDGFLGGAENHLFSKVMVDHDQQGIEARGDREVSDEVTRDLLEGVRYMRFDGDKWRNGGICIQLVLLTCSTAVNIFSYVLCKT